MANPIDNQQGESQQVAVEGDRQKAWRTRARGKESGRIAYSGSEKTDGKRWGLVIGAGGSSGAFSAGALYGLKTEFGLDFPVISGTSTGALQATLVGLDEFTLLSDIYLNISKADVVESRNLLSAWLKGAFHGTAPLQRLIEAYAPAAKLQAVWPDRTVIVTAVNLRTGKIKRCTNRPDDMSIFHRMVLASASEPVLMDPVEIDGDLYVDGGIMDFVPVSAILERCRRPLDGLIVITNSPLAVPELDKNPVGLLPILNRTIDIMLGEIQRNDLKLAVLQNMFKSTLAQALQSPTGQPSGVNLPLGPMDLEELLSRGNTLPIIHIAPEKFLGDGLVFDPLEMEKYWQQGFDAALKSPILETLEKKGTYTVEYSNGHDLARGVRPTGTV